MSAPAPAAASPASSVLQAPATSLRAERLSRAPLVLATAVGLLSVVAGLLLARAPTPQRGIPINEFAFKVDVAWLENWATTGEGRTHAAAAALAATFKRNRNAAGPDAALKHFLNASAAASASQRGRAVTLAKWNLFWALQRYLGWSRTDASGFLRLATLYVASEEQLGRLAHAALDAPSHDADGAPRSLLDIGAGTGTETAKLAAALGVAPARVTALESSRALRRALRARGFRAASAPDELHDAPPFTAAALLNVLDRCDAPATLVDAAVAAVAPGGVLMLATVLPFKAKVFEGRVGAKWGKPASRAPRKPLKLVRRAWPAEAPDFEAGAAAFLDAISRRHPQLELASWTRLPYVSSGGTKTTHSHLSMALMAFRVNSNNTSRQQQPNRRDPRVK